MMDGYAGLIKLAIFFTLTFAFIGYELRSVSKAIERDSQQPRD